MRRIRLILFMGSLLLLIAAAAPAAPIHDAVSVDDIEKVRAILQADPAAVDALDDNLERPLHWAIYRKDANIVDLLLAKGATVDVWAAAGMGRMDDLKRMIEADPKMVNARMKLLVTPLHWAATEGKTEATAYLIEKGAEVDARDSHFATPLGRAVQYGNMDVAKLLLKAKASPNADGPHGLPLSVAVQRRDVAMATLLLDSGAEMKLADRWGQTPLQTAAQMNAAEFVKLFLDRGATLDAYSATALGKTAELAQMLATDPELVKAKRPDGQTLLHWAAAAGQVEAARLLLEKGARPDAQDAWKRTPLSIATRSKNQALIALFTPKAAAAPAPTSQTP